jgi:hypothetical protein
MEMRLWIPEESATTTAWLLPGSALVSVACSGEQVVCYAEGNMYGAENMHTLADRAMHAAGRLRTGYPTVAARSIQRSQITPVGSYDEDRGEIRLTPGSEHIVARWIGCSLSELSNELCTTSSASHEAQRALIALEQTPHGHLQAQWLRRHGPIPYRTQL